MPGERESLMFNLVCKRKFKFLTSIAMLLTALLCFFLSGGSELGKAGYRPVDERPKLVVGSDIYPPFNYVDENGNPTGIDVELAKEAGRRMGYKVQFVQINWEDKNRLLERNEVDCLWGSFSMAGRAQQYRWAGPYMVSRQVVAVNPNSSIHSLADLKGKLVAVQTTTKPEEILMKHTDSRIPRVRKLFSMENREWTYAMLGKGYVDAMAMHELAIREYNDKVGTNYRILDEPLLVTGLGVAFALNDKRGIAEKLDQTLKEMQADGTTKKIVEKYVGNADRYLEVGSLGN